MELKINVVEKDGELLFQYDGSNGDRILFDCLNAFDEFSGGALKVMRNDEIFEETESIAEYGSHGAAVCFHKVDKITDVWRGTVSHIDTRNLQLGDVLILNVSDVDFVKIMKDFAEKFFAFREALPSGESITAAELDKRMAEELKKDHVEPEVLRFIL